MARHTINKDDSKGLIVEKNIAESFGRGEAKVLKLVIDVDNKTFTYQVTDHHNEVVYEGENKELAVNVYNNIFSY